MPNLIKSSADLTENDRDKAEELSEYFRIVFTIEDVESMPTFGNHSGENTIEDIEISECMYLYDDLDWITL